MAERRRHDCTQGRVAEPKASASPSELGCAATRVVFADLVAAGIRALGTSPSPLAVSYLIGLLDLQVRSPEVVAMPRLAEALLAGISDGECAQISRLRELGDRALFMSGFFGEGLRRNATDVDCYQDVGRTAYDRLSAQFARSGDDCGWRELFRELADEFGAFVELLAEVGGRTRRDAPVDLLRIHDRYLRTGSERDRRLLIRHGMVPHSVASAGRWQ